jgi:hypothetical protein
MLAFGVAPNGLGPIGTNGETELRIDTRDRGQLGVVRPAVWQRNCPNSRGIERPGVRGDGWSRADKQRERRGDQTAESGAVSRPFLGILARGTVKW